MKQMGSVNDRDYKRFNAVFDPVWGYIPHVMRVREWPL